MNNDNAHCDFCNLSIQKQKHVQIPSPDGGIYFHNRYVDDCFDRMSKKAALRTETRPTPAAMGEYEKWLAQRDAKSAVGRR